MNISFLKEEYDLRYMDAVYLKELMDILYNTDPFYKNHLVGILGEIKAEEEKKTIDELYDELDERKDEIRSLEIRITDLEELLKDNDVEVPIYL